MAAAPTPQEFHAQLNLLRDSLYQTPVHSWESARKQKLLGTDTRVFFKLELMQKTGSFKARGALSVIRALSPSAKKNGVVAGTAGNHGIAVSFAAKEAGINARIIVPEKINPYRLSQMKALGADIEFVDHVGLILDRMNEISQNEGRVAVHPFENPLITLGTGTIGVELLQQVSDLEAVIVPIGGGGLASGIATAIKQILPACKIYGVEPENANSMSLSIKENAPVSLKQAPKSIADSLCAPRAEPYSFSLCKEFLDDVVLIEDLQMVDAMKILMDELKLITEPAGAAATAALLGPLKRRCLGKRTAIIVCGSNIDLSTFSELLSITDR